MDESLSQFIDLQLYGRAKLLMLFRPPGEKTDLLFVATKSYNYFLLQWDTSTSKVITRAKGKVPDIDRARVKHPICITNPSCTVVALHLFRNYIEVIPCLHGHVKELHSKKLEHDVVDLKFLSGFTKPTIALLYKLKSDNGLEISYHLETLEISLDDKSCTFHVPFSVKLEKKANLIIPLLEPPFGGLVIGDKYILYLNESISELIETDNETIKFYSRLDDDFRFLLVDKNGRTHLLSINFGSEKCDLKIDLIGEVSVYPSTIALIGKDVIFVGSRSGDSQVMKLNSLPNGWFLEVLERYVNIGPILDFCLVEESAAMRQGKITIITCSGVEKSASLRILHYGYRIDKMVSTQLEGITGLWSLRLTDVFKKFLVISFLSSTWVFALTNEEVLEETEIEGFSTNVRTYYSHDAAYKQLIQITSASVRLICSISGKLLDIWETPDFIINVATANLLQVLVAGEGSLVYLEIGKGVLHMKKHERKFNVSCLDITPVDEDPEYSKLAAVGMWNDMSVNTLSPRIYILSLPSFQHLINVPLGETVPRSVLLCSFEEIPNLLCGTGDGLLFQFLLDKQSGSLTERTHLSLGSQPVSLLACTSKDATLVIATSNKPSVIYISKKKLVCSSLDLREVTFMCSFNSASCPNSLAIAEEGELSIYTVDYPELLTETIPLQEQAQRICYQKDSRTCVVCCSSYNKPTNEFIGSLRLLNIETFVFISNYPLHQYEFSLCLISCSFSNDKNAYYCVGTGYMDQNGDTLDKGRILVLLVEDGKLKLVAEKEISSRIPSLTVFQGELLASVLDKINSYQWKLYRDGTCGLQLTSVCGGLFTCPYLESKNKTVALGGRDVTLALLIREDEKGTFKQLGRLQANSCTAIKILDNNTYIASDSASNLFTVCTNHEGALENKRGFLQVVGRYHLDDFVNRLEHGSLLMGMPGSGRFPTCLYGTTTGCLGVVASLPHDMYSLLEKLQTTLRDVVTSIGGLCHQEWRSCSSELEVKIEDAENFLDGDLLETFLDLTPMEMESVATAMDVPVEKLEKTIQDLKRMC